MSDEYQSFQRGKDGVFKELYYNDTYVYSKHNILKVMNQMGNGNKDKDCTYRPKINSVEQIDRIVMNSGDDQQEHPLKIIYTKSKLLNERPNPDQ